MGRRNDIIAREKKKSQEERSPILKMLCLRDKSLRKCSLGFDTRNFTINPIKRYSSHHLLKVYCPYVPTPSHRPSSFVLVPLIPSLFFPRVILTVGLRDIYNTPPSSSTMPNFLQHISNKSTIQAILRQRLKE